MLAKIGVCFVAGIIVIGIGGSAFYLWKYHRPTARNATIVNLSIPRQNSTKASTAEEDDSYQDETALDDDNAEVTDEVLDEKKADDNIRFLVIGGRNVTEFSDLESALREIDGEPKDSLTLKIGFSNERILSRVSENDFRAWLARIGDYIFARRILLVTDLADVLRNPKLSRTPPDKIDKRGCIIFKQQEKTWWVEIRGLENHVDELKIVAEEILLRGITSPQNIEKCQTLEPVSISDRLKSMDRKLSEEQVDISNAFIDLATFDENEFPSDMEDNLCAFLPLVSFDHLFHREDKDNIVTQETDKFLNEFYERIVSKYMVNIADRDGILNKLADKPYLWLVKRLKKWANKSDISTLLKTSLFNDL